MRMRSGSGCPAARAERVPLALCLMLSAAVLALPGAASAETWCGLMVVPEHRCASHDEKRDRHDASAAPALTRIGP